MKKMIMICFILVTHHCFAYNNMSSLTLTLINHSKETLVFTKTTGQNPTNSFEVIPQKILPGNSAVIIGKTSSDFDLSGQLHFTDSTQDNILTIVDHRQFHVGQPIFSMANEKIISQVLSRTINSEINPKALMYSAAEIDIRGW